MLFCGEPVTSPSTDGPLVCGWCDYGSNKDGKLWTYEESVLRWEHRKRIISDIIKQQQQQQQQ